MKRHKRKHNRSVAAVDPERFPQKEYLFPRWLVIAATAVLGAVVLSSYPGSSPDGIFNFLKIFDGASVAGFLVKLPAHVFVIAVAAAVMLSAFAAGGALSRFFPPPETAYERFFFTTAAGLGLLALAIFFAGSAGFLGKKFFVVFIAVAALVGAFRAARMVWPSPRSGGSPSVPAPGFSFWEKAGAAAILAVMLVNLFGALTPETFYDSQFYLAGLPASWINDGAITSSKFMPPSFFPFNVSMLFLAAMLSGGMIPAKILVFIFGAMTTLAVYSLGARLFSRRAGIYAALIFCSVPTVMMVSWKTAVEHGIGVFEFAAVMAAVRYIESRDGRWIFLAGLLCGFSAGSKYTGLVFCMFPMAAALFLVESWSGNNYVRALRAAAIFSVAAIASAAPWYIRNFIVSGNPVFPFFWKTVGRLPLRETVGFFDDPPRPALTFANYAGFLWQITMRSFETRPFQQESFPGPVFLIFVVPAIFASGRGKNGRFLGVYLAFSTVMWAVFGRFYLRYFVPSITVAALVYASGIFSGRRPVWNGLASAAVIYMALMNAGFTAGVLVTTQAPAPYVAGHTTESEYLSTQRPSYPAPYYHAAEWADKNLPPEARILFMGETRGAYWRRRFFANGAGDFSYLVEWLKESRSADDFASRLSSAGVTHIFFNSPEAARLSGYEPFYFEPRDLEIFDEFWIKYVREIHRAVADMYSPQHGITSMRRDRPDWWAQYASDPSNYAYLYEIVASPSESALSSAPPNPLLSKKYYPDRRWRVIEQTAARLIARRDRRQK